MSWLVTISTFGLCNLWIIEIRSGPRSLQWPRHALPSHLTTTTLTDMPPAYALLGHGIRRSLCTTKALPHFRHIATTSTSQDAANLPLAGIRVLDMTRVLAGVSDITFSKAPS